MPVAMAGYKLTLSQKDGYEKYSLITFLLIWVATHCANAQEKILQFVTGQEINVGTLSEDDEASAYRLFSQFK